MAGDALRDAVCKDVSVHRERGPTGDTRGIRRFQDHAAQDSHFSLEQAVGVAGFCALEGVRADQLRELFGLVGRRLANRTHLVEYNATAALGELPSGFAAGQSPTDYVNRSTFMPRHALTIATRR